VVERLGARPSGPGPRRGRGARRGGLHGDKPQDHEGREHNLGAARAAGLEQYRERLRKERCQRAEHAVAMDATGAPRRRAIAAAPTTTPATAGASAAAAPGLSYWHRSRRHPFAASRTHRTSRSIETEVDGAIPPPSAKRSPPVDLSSDRS
jgi:hypothetical protein